MAWYIGLKSWLPLNNPGLITTHAWNFFSVASCLHDFLSISVRVEDCFDLLSNILIAANVIILDVKSPNKKCSPGRLSLWWFADRWPDRWRCSRWTCDPSRCECLPWFACPKPWLWHPDHNWQERLWWGEGQDRRRHSSDRGSVVQPKYSKRLNSKRPITELHARKFHIQMQILYN